MSKPTRVEIQPRSIELIEGKTYAWCACGLSQNQPFCDASHKKTDLQPKVFRVEKTESKWLCMCKGTSNQPFCDGSHKA